MAAVIEMLNGTYNIQGKPVQMKGYRFELVRPFKNGAVTVNGASIMPALRGPAGGVNIPPRNIRIKCKSGTSYIVVDGEVSASPVGDKSFAQIKVSDSTVANESDDQIVERLRSRFQVLQDMTSAVKQGHVRAMIVTGPPGVGKSFGVDEVLNKDDLFNTLGNKKPKYEIVKGAMSAIGLYKKLWEYCEKGNVIVFDDCDSVLLDDLSLNILKAALDSSKTRTIAWNTDSRSLDGEGIPNKFEFKAGAIFITNIKFENVRSKKLQDHLAALESRCHYIDLQMDTEREKVLRIKQIVNDGMLESYEFTDIERDEVVDYVMSNRANLRELSLRTVLKVADLRKSFALNWKEMCNVTCMRRGV